MKNKISEKMPEVINSIENFFKDLPGKFYQWGIDMIENFKKGIENKVNDVKSAVQGIGEGIKSVLHHSTPDEGPLKDDDKWMPDMMDNFTKGIKGKIPEIYNISKKLSSEIQNGLNLNDLYGRMKSAVDFETGRLSANLSTTALVSRSLNANITLKSADIYMDSNKVGRAITPAISKTIRTAGV